MFDMTDVKYYRWQRKYYIDNCLEDNRGRYERNKVRLEDIYRKHIIDIRKEGYLGNAVIGPERIMDALEEQQIYLSHETIRKVLHQEGLIEPQIRVPVHEYKRFEAEAPNVMWQTDIMYLWIVEFGYMYLMSILDDYSRKILYWELLDRATSKDAKEVLVSAMDSIGVTPESVLTDRGTQFHSGDGKALVAFEQYLKTNKIEHKLARVRHPQTLGKIERYHRSLRQEWVNHYEYHDAGEARRSVREYVEKYNYFRKHKGIGRVTPEQRYTGRDIEIKKKRGQIRKNVIAMRQKRLSELEIQKEIALIEIVTQLTDAMTKEVVLV
jgi:transposase InsO family protein